MSKVFGVSCMDKCYTITKDGGFYHLHLYCNYGLQINREYYEITKCGQFFTSIEYAEAEAEYYMLKDEDNPVLKIGQGHTNRCRTYTNEKNTVKIHKIDETYYCEFLHDGYHVRNWKNNSTHWLEPCKCLSQAINKAKYYVRKGSVL